MSLVKMYFNLRAMLHLIAVHKTILDVGIGCISVPSAGHNHSCNCTCIYVLAYCNNNKTFDKQSKSAFWLAHLYNLSYLVQPCL